MNNLLMVCKKPSRNATRQQKLMYNPKCVNKQMEHLSKWCNADNFYVYSDFDKSEFNSDIKVIEIPDEPQWQGWWSKIFMYGHTPKGLNVFVDLDSEFYGDGNIFWEIDKTDKPMFWFEPQWDHYPCGARRLNSSILRWSEDQLLHIYERYIADFKHIHETHANGDDHFLTKNMSNSEYYLWPLGLFHSTPEMFRKNPTVVPNIKTLPLDFFDNDTPEILGYRIFTYPNNLKPVALMKRFKHIQDYWEGAF